MHGVERARLLGREAHPLHREKPKALPLEVREDRAHLARRDGVGLQNRQGPFAHDLSFEISEFPRRSPGSLSSVATPAIAERREQPARAPASRPSASNRRCRVIRTPRLPARAERPPPAEAPHAPAAVVPDRPIRDAPPRERDLAQRHARRSREAVAHPSRRRRVRSSASAASATPSRSRADGRQQHVDPGREALRLLVEDRAARSSAEHLLHPARRCRPATARRRCPPPRAPSSCRRPCRARPR